MVMAANDEVIRFWFVRFCFLTKVIRFQYPLFREVFYPANAELSLKKVLSIITTGNVIKLRKMKATKSPGHHPDSYRDSRSFSLCFFEPLSLCGKRNP